MRRKDIAVVLVVVVLSVVLSAVVSNLVFAKPKDRQQKAEVVQAISADFANPDERYFNKDAVDVAEPIRIGDTTNPDPFREAAKP